MNKTVVSGIRATGHLHIGNYFGALKQAVAMQEAFNCYYFIADYHSLTTHPSTENFHNDVRQVLIECLACGIDPEKSALYVQSHVPEITELYLLLGMLAYKGELERCTSFKDKARQHPDNINAGLLTYPVLMAADILIHRGSKVPVGKDQEQHLEMARDFARRFNHLYKSDVLPEPVAFNYENMLVKVPSLDGTGKMSKSLGEQNAIFFTDETKALQKKVMRAKTDSGPTEKNQPKPEAIQNLFDLMAFVSAEDTVRHFNEAYDNCTIRYGDLKKQLAEDMEIFVAPFREKIKSISADEKALARAAQTGADKARESARETLRLVKDAMGFKPFY